MKTVYRLYARVIGDRPPEDFTLRSSHQTLADAKQARQNMQREFRTRAMLPLPGNGERDKAHYKIVLEEN